MTESFDAVLADGRDVVVFRLKCRGENITDRKLEAMLDRLQSTHEAEVAEWKARAGRAMGLLRDYRMAPKFSHDHAAIKRAVELGDEIDIFLSEQAGERENGDG